MSSPLRPVNNTSTRAASHPTVKRRLDFSTEELKPSIERSPQRERQLRASNRSQPLSAGSRLSGGSSSASQPSSKQGKRKVFDLGAHDDDGDDENDEESATFEDEVHQLNGVAEVDDINGTAEESMQIMYDEDDDQHPFDVDYESPSLVRSPKSKRGRPRKNVSGGSEVLPVTAPITKKRGGRKSDLAPVDADSSQVSIEAKPRRGRRPKNPETAAPLEVEEDENEGERPAKRARNTKVDGAPVDIAPQDTRPPPAKRGPKAKVTSATATKAKADVVEPEVPQRSNGRPKPRSLYVMRSGTPAEDDGSRTTRSGRTSVKPLAYWRNERIVYGEDEGKAGERYLLPTIKEVIRTEEVVEPRPKRAKGRPRMAGRKRQLEELEEEDEEQEPWETEEGVKRGPVRAWNPVQGSDVEDEEEECTYITKPTPYPLPQYANPHQPSSHTLKQPSKPAKFTTAPSATPK